MFKKAFIVLMIFGNGAISAALGVFIAHAIEGDSAGMIRGASMGGIVGLMTGIATYIIYRILCESNSQDSEREVRSSPVGLAPASQVEDHVELNYKTSPQVFQPDLQESCRCSQNPPISLPNLRLLHN